MDEIREVLIEVGMCGEVGVALAVCVGRGMTASVTVVALEDNEHHYTGFAHGADGLCEVSHGDTAMEALVSAVRKLLGTVERREAGVGEVL